MIKLIKYPGSLTPAAWTGERTTPNGDPITDEAENDFIFSCHKVVSRNDFSVVLYGQLNEQTALAQWGQRRYVTILIKKNAAFMNYLDGPRNF